VRWEAKTLRGTASGAFRGGFGCGRGALARRVRAEERAHVDADAEGEGVELQGNAAAVSGFQIEIGTRLDFHARIEAVITGEARAASLNTGGRVALAIR